MISVIVPCYNGAKYINRLFDCLERQTSHDFELVFVDDGSTDESARIARANAERSSFRCKVLCIENNGVSHARNVGLENVSGEYISFVDVDDIISEDRISFFENCFNNYDVDAVITQMKKIEAYDEMEQVNFDQPTEVSFEVLSKTQILDSFLEETVKTGACGGCFKSNIIKNNNLHFPEGCKYNEDLIFMWHVFVNSERVCVTNKVDYYYMWVSGSAMSRFDANRLAGYEEMRNLSTYIFEKAPEFAPRFSKYAPSRIMWSICRQCACRSNYKDFRSFFIQYNVRKDMLNLVSYSNPLVKISAVSYLIHPYMFYLMANIQGRKNVHK